MGLVRIGAARPNFVAVWHCRACKGPVAITDVGVDRADAFDRVLVGRGEQPIDRERTMFCNECRVHYRAKYAEHNSKRVAEMRDVIRKLKGSRNPENEREAMKQLEAWGHPDVPGLVQAIRNRLDGNTPDNHQRKRKAGDA